MLKEAFYAQFTFNVKSSPFSTELKEIFMLFYVISKIAGL
jgi:hypothetical protein